MTNWEWIKLQTPEAWDSSVDVWIAKQARKALRKKKKEGSLPVGRNSGDGLQS